MKVIHNDKRGYTLVELMVVVTIMAILAAASTPIFTGYIKKAKTSEYLTECRAVYMAAEAYFIETSGKTSDDVDLDHLEEEIERLTAVDVDILENEEEKLQGKYGIIVSDSASGKWNCDAVVCEIDGERWMFFAESGEFAKIK